MQLDLHIDERYNQNIYVNKLIPDNNKQRAARVNLIDTKRMKYLKMLVRIEDKKECKILKERYKVALYTGDDKVELECRSIISDEDAAYLSKSLLHFMIQHDITYTNTT